ncbi:MAG: recombinase family protein [Acetobacteraceae bacterium]|nr:recombinase family protein [Acetobacteraceae bacterium]
MPVVAYYRVSTERQGRSGLGLDAQRERCDAFAMANSMEVVDAFTGDARVGSGLHCACPLSAGRLNVSLGERLIL